MPCGRYYSSFINHYSFYSKNMDALSSEFHLFLIRLGQQPNCVSEKVGHYIKHLLRLLYPDEEQVMIEFYGLFETPIKSLEDLAYERNLSSEQLHKTIEASLRKIAVTPEWQMIKQFTK